MSRPNRIAISLAEIQLAGTDLDADQLPILKALNKFYKFYGMISGWNARSIRPDAVA